MAHPNAAGGFAGTRIEDLILAVTEALSRRQATGATSRPLPVVMASLDCARAFQTTDHTLLWWRLGESGVRGRLWRVMRASYADAKCVVRVGGSSSDGFELNRGLREGLPSSPVLYTLFYQAILERLEAAGLGVVVKGVWLGGLLYTDDLALQARSGAELQAMLDVVSEFAAEFRLTYNAAQVQDHLPRSCRGRVETRQVPGREPQRRCGERVEAWRPTPACVPLPEVPERRAQRRFNIPLHH